MKAGLLVLVVAAAASTGCFASKTDFLKLQDEVALTRASDRAADSANREQLASVTRSLRALTDSLASLNRKVTVMRSTSESELVAIRQDIAQLQDLSGQSEQRLRDMRARLEEKAGPADPATPPARLEPMPPPPRGHHPVQRDRDPLSFCRQDATSSLRAGTRRRAAPSASSWRNTRIPNTRRRQSSTPRNRSPRKEIQARQIRRTSCSSRDSPILRGYPPRCTSERSTCRRRDARRRRASFIRKSSGDSLAPTRLHSPKSGSRPFGSGGRR
jgi:hypothetical protein